MHIFMGILDIIGRLWCRCRQWIGIFCG